MNESIAIIGGGQAGASAAQALRARGYANALHLICAEGVLPYERPPLSKAMLCSGEDPTWVLPSDFYAAQQVDVHLSSRVTAVSTIGSLHAVHLERGAVLEADTVILATGSVPRRLRVPGFELPGVHTLGDIEDLTALREDLASARHVVIGGGGFIGAEVAGGLRSQGIDVTVIDPVASPLAAKTAPWVAELLERRHRRAGVRQLLGSVAEIRGATRVESVVTGDGVVLDCDVFLVAVGSRPADDLAKSMGLNCTDGILCDGRGRTSASGVYAMGDVASWLYPVLGQARIEHFRTAIEHADVVAADIVGADLPGLRAPWFWTDQYEHRVEVAGRPGLADEVVLRPGPDGQTAMSLHLLQGRVVGVVGIDAPRDVRTASRLIDNQNIVDPAVVVDPTLDLRKAVVK